MLKAGRGRVATVTAAVAGLLAAGAPGAMALTGSGGTPGQWPMAGQNIDDTHFQAAEHEISPASVGRLAPRWTLTTAGARVAITLAVLSHYQSTSTPMLRAVPAMILAA